MGVDVQMRITGFDELERKLESMPQRAAAQALKTGLASGAEIWREEMKLRVRRGWHHWRVGRRGTRHSEGAAPVAKAPVFGFLAEHEAMRVTIQSDDIAGVAKVGPAKAGFWARFLEYGTRRMPAYPFIRPTFESKQAAAIDAFRNALREALRSS